MRDLLVCGLEGDQMLLESPEDGSFLHQPPARKKHVPGVCVIRKAGVGNDDGNQWWQLAMLMLTAVLKW